MAKKAQAEAIEVAPQEIKVPKVKKDTPRTKNKFKLSLLGFNKFTLFILFFLYRNSFIVPIHKY